MYEFLALGAIFMLANGEMFRWSIQVPSQDLGSSARFEALGRASHDNGRAGNT